MALPDFDDAGNLPPGTMPRRGLRSLPISATRPRRVLSEGLSRVLDLLAAVGCRRVWLAGSLVTRSEQTLGRDPADFDLCWDITGVDLATLVRHEPALVPPRPDQRALYHRYGGDLFYVLEPLNVGGLEDFQHDCEGRRKGIILLELSEGGA